MLFENTVKKYVNEKEKSLNTFSDQVDEIRKNLIEKNIGRLNDVLERLKQKGYSDEQAQNLVNQYQKKLIYNNEAANVPAQLLIIITLVCVVEILGFLYLILR